MLYQLWQSNSPVMISQNVYPAHRLLISEQFSVSSYEIYEFLILFGLIHVLVQFVLQVDEATLWESQQFGRKLIGNPYIISLFNSNRSNFFDSATKSRMYFWRTLCSGCLSLNMTAVHMKHRFSAPQIIIILIVFILVEKMQTKNWIYNKRHTTKKQSELQVIMLSSSPQL